MYWKHKLGVISDDKYYEFLKRDDLLKDFPFRENKIKTIYPPTLFKEDD